MSYIIRTLKEFLFRFIPAFSESSLVRIEMSFWLNLYVRTWVIFSVKRLFWWWDFRPLFPSRSLGADSAHWTSSLGPPGMSPALWIIIYATWWPQRTLSLRGPLSSEPYPPFVNTRNEDPSSSSRALLLGSTSERTETVLFTFLLKTLHVNRVRDTISWWLVPSSEVVSEWGLPLSRKEGGSKGTSKGFSLIHCTNL